MLGAAKQTSAMPENFYKECCNPHPTHAFDTRTMIRNLLKIIETLCCDKVLIGGIRSPSSPYNSRHCIQAMSTRRPVNLYDQQLLL